MFLKRSRGEAKILRAMLFQIFMDSLRAFPPKQKRNYKNFFQIRKRTISSLGIFANQHTYDFENPFPSRDNRLFNTRFRRTLFYAISHIPSRSTACSVEYRRDFVALPVTKVRSFSASLLLFKIVPARSA